VPANKFSRGIIFGFGFPCKWIVAIFWDGGEACFLNREPFKNKMIEARK
jgi:hypothetical protein